MKKTDYKPLCHENIALKYKKQHLREFQRERNKSKCILRFLTYLFQKLVTIFSCLPFWCFYSNTDKYKVTHTNSYFSPSLT